MTKTSTATERLVDCRIYVASLADYNAGRLHGVWIDLDGKDTDDVRAEITAMLKRSPEEIAEDYAIHDYEGFCSIRIEEYDGIDRVCDLAVALEEHGEAFAAFYGHYGYDDVEEALTRFEDAYAGEMSSFQDYAEELFDELYAHDIPEPIRFYIDYEKFANDLLLSGDYSTEDSRAGTVFVFRN